MVNEATKRKISGFQKNEITEHLIYAKLSKAIKDKNNSDILRRISEDELKHYNIWKKYSGKDVAPDTLKIWKYYLIAKILGLTFGIKLMENGEVGAQAVYKEISKEVPQALEIAEEEDRHENDLINLIDEERLRYVGSIVLGLNDALVELTGALAGFTLALQNTKTVATAGLITGIAASLSMAASEYLSKKSEAGEKNPLKSCIYTGIAYILTVLYLVYPYFVFKNVYFCLFMTLNNAISVILFFTFYVSVAKGMPFKKRFLEMAGISLGVAALSFGIGFLVRQFLHIDI